jgi:hypothetical protein
MFIVVFVSGGFCVVSAISSLYGAVSFLTSFSLIFLGGAAGLYLTYRNAENARHVAVATVAM